MAEASEEQLYEMVLDMEQRFSNLSDALGEIKREVEAINGQLAAAKRDLSNFCEILSRHDTRLDRIERCLDLNSAADRPQPYQNA